MHDPIASDSTLHAASSLGVAEKSRSGMYTAPAQSQKAAVMVLIIDVSMSTPRLLPHRCVHACTKLACPMSLLADGLGGTSRCGMQDRLGGHHATRCTAGRGGRCGHV